MHNPFSRFFAAPKKPAAPARQEIARIGTGRDLTRGWIADDLLLDPQDSVLQSRDYKGTRGWDLFRDLLTDWVVFSALQQRRQAVVAAETEVIPGGTKRADKNAAAFLEETLDAVGWDQVCDLMHYGIYYGFGVGECLWGRDGAQVTLDQIRVRDRRRFAFDGAQRLRLLTLASPMPGELLPERKFWAFQTGADHADEPYGMGLAHWLYWPVRFKRGGVEFWMISVEKFGTPTAAGWFPPGTSQEDRDKLLATLGSIKNQAAIILPQGITTELLETKRGAGVDYATLCGYMDQAISKIILSQLAPADSTANKLNVSAQEPPAWQRLIKSDADLLCESFNQGPARWLTEWNFPGAVPPRVYRRTEPSDDLAQRSAIERRLFDLGYRPTLQQIKDEYDGEWEAVPTMEPAQTTKTSAAPDDPLTADVIPDGDPATDTAFAAFATSPPDPVAALTERLGAEAEPLLQTLLDPVQAALDASADLMDFRERLLTLYPELDGKAFADLMGQALAVADAQGQWEAGHGG